VELVKYLRAVRKLSKTQEQLVEAIEAACMDFRLLNAA
jgi:hypothetical protein